MTDLHIEAVAAMERAKGFAHVRRINDQWRREVGMTGRQMEEVREVLARAHASVIGIKESLAKFTTLHNPGAPDGRNSWEDDPAPIWDAVVAEMGAPL